jgi:ribosomal protein S18 acetylase RimI-like enzyme
MDLQIRRLEQKDAEIVALLGRITSCETFGYLFKEHVADLRAYLDRTFDVEKLRRSLERARNGYWLTFANGLPIGYAKLKHPSPTILPDGGEIGQRQKIYMLAEFVGQGGGRLLLEAVLAHAASRGIDAVWLGVLKENSRAIRFYEGFGFVALGEDVYTIGAQTFTFHLMVLRKERASSVR